MFGTCRIGSLEIRRKPEAVPDKTGDFATQLFCFALDGTVLLWMVGNTAFEAQKNPPGFSLAGFCLERKCACADQLY
jgi:hypothetical protein